MAKEKGKGFGKKWNKEQERMGVYTPLPKGRYFLRCVESEIKHNSKKTGRNYKVAWEVIKGEFKSRQIKLSHSFDNPNEQAEDIAAKEIASMCDAVGIKFEKFDDPKEILKKKIQADVTIDTPEEGSQYGPSNKIAQYLEYDAPPATKTKGAPMEKEDKKGKGKGKGKKGEGPKF